ncbi:MAG: DNA polymerase III subunit gamma/tau [Clostridiales bacterium]|nr:DNA polymerase III subunit gamma/tau [Clostridiales bacterium]
MDKYIVSARKYRPSTFASVVGQSALTSTLKNAIATDRLAHAYLFCGSRGVGKTSCARVFAKSINCENRTPDGDPCNECDSCREFNNGSSLNIVELDAASNNGVEDIRALVDQVQVPPTNGKYRVFIIDEVHMLSSSAFNAFLKTLEEPPSYVVFILATTEKHKIIPTILSRCQIYDFNRITIQDMVSHLEYIASREGITAEPSALGVIAKKADGAMRDALSIFDQVAASSRGNITYRSAVENLNVLDSSYFSRLVDCFLAQNVPGSLLLYKDVRDHGFDSHAFINGLAAYIRDLMVCRQEETRQLADTDADTLNSMSEQAVKCDPTFLYQAMSLCNDADLNYRQATSKNFLVELLLIKLCQLLSPSPIFSGDGEGPLQPLQAAAPSQRPAAAAVMPATPAAGGVNPTPATPPSVTRGAQPAPSATPVTRHRPVGAVPHTISIRLSTTSRQAENNAATVVQESPRRNGKYTPEMLAQAWESYMSIDPTRRILVNTMRASRPIPIEGGPDRYTITVENPAQLDMMNSEMPQLLAHLHDALGNDMVALEVRLNQGATSPSTWSEREVIEYMCKEHENVKKLISTLKLSLT